MKCNRFFLTITVLLLLTVFGCTVDSTRGGSTENTQTAQQAWMPAWQQVAGSNIGIGINTTIRTFVDGAGLHEVGSSSNRIYYQRTSLDGLTVLSSWAEIPGQGNGWSQYTPMIVRIQRLLRTQDQYMVLRTVTSTGAIEFTILRHYLVGNTWVWSGTWTAISPLGTGHNLPVAAAFVTSTNRVYVFASASFLGNTIVSYSDNSGGTWSSAYNVDSTQSGQMTAVDHYVSPSEHHVELFRRHRTSGAVSWNRMLVPTPLDATAWSGWQSLGSDTSADLGSLVQKNLNVCVYISNDNDNYEKCTTNGQPGGSPSVFATTWTPIAPYQNTYWGISAGSYCDSWDSTPDICTNGSTQKLITVSKDYPPQNLLLQRDTK